MHIPDGYLSPQTTIPAFALMAGIWYLAFKKVKLAQNPHSIPTIALCAAFSFVIMMFNIPVIGGSSAHAVGAVLVAILVGPWTAILAVSATLMIQALIFGDGGILALGVNCLNMAVAMPVSGYMVYRLISGTSKPGSSRNLAAAAIGAYAGINLAALAAGIEMGIQPVLFTTPDGTPLYGFYSLAVTVPAMLIAHLVFAGPLDGVITALALSYIVKFAPHLLDRQEAVPKSVSWISRNKALLCIFGLLIILTPLGLLASNTAFGEWGTEEVKQLIGYIPAGMAKSADWWHALLPDYSLPGLDSSFISRSVAYILSAIVGVGIISGLILIMAKIAKTAENK